jgi:hypothetical protein
MNSSAEEMNDLLFQKSSEIASLLEELHRQRMNYSILEAKHDETRALATQYQQERDILERALNKMHEERAVQKSSAWSDSIQNYEGENA